MSDYIKRQDVLDIIHKEIESTTTYLEHHTQINIKFAVEELPTVDEKEIIRKAFERVVEKLCDLQPFLTADGQYVSLYEVVQTIKKECGINE